LMGRDYSVADAHFFVVSNWASWVRFDLSPYANVASYRTRRIGGRGSNSLAQLTALTNRNVHYGSLGACPLYPQKRTYDGLPARADLVLRFGLEIAGVMALVQLFVRRPAGAVDPSPALDGRALTDFLRTACQVFIFMRLQE